MLKYLTIKEAQEQITSKSRLWYQTRIKAGDIKSASAGQGSDHLIDAQSLLNYLEGLANQNEKSVKD